jgi:putative PIN family toxin of toxin-antitoxin system
LRAVLDTSVLVAAFLHPAGVNGRVLALAGERYELCLSTAILAEVRKVLSYPRLRRYGYSEEEVEEFLRALREAASSSAAGPGSRWSGKIPRMTRF